MKMRFDRPELILLTTIFNDVASVAGKNADRASRRLAERIADKFTLNSMESNLNASECLLVIRLLREVKGRMDKYKNAHPEMGDAQMGIYAENYAVLVNLELKLLDYIPKFEEILAKKTAEFRFGDK